MGSPSPLFSTVTARERTSLATGSLIGSDTVDEDLRRQLDVREGSLSHHFDAIGESGSGAVC